MIGCIMNQIFFMYFIAMPNELPDWLRILNIICYVVSVIGAVVAWEIHKNKVETLEREIVSLTEKKDE